MSTEDLVEKYVREKDKMQRVARLNGYKLMVFLPSGEWAAVRSFIYTFALLVGLDETGYRTRFCYERELDAMRAAIAWNGQGDPPGPWIKEKGRVERDNPSNVSEFKAIPVVTITVTR